MSIKITVNGAGKEVPDGLNIAGLLELLHIPTDRVAIERNRQIVRKSDWAATIITSGDSIEVVTFVGGGSL
jgi:thiamine biosynthesis protein ThiS